MQFARHLLEYLAARTLVAILALLPLRASAAASAIVPSTSAIQSWKVSPFSTPAATSAFLPM